MKKIACLILALCVLLTGCSILEELLEVESTKAPIPDSDIVQYRELRYFVNRLDDASLANFCALYQSIQNFEEICRLPYPATTLRMSVLMNMLKYECPELMQLDLTQEYTYYTVDDMVERVQLPYGMDPETYPTCAASCKKVLEELDRMTQGMTDRDKELAVYNYIAQKCTYSDTAENAANAYGALVAGAAKCDGIAMGLKWALEYLGIPCAAIAGDPVDGGVGHAWNVVCLDGQWYDVDLTADVGEENMKYGACNVSDTWIRDQYLVKSRFTYFGPLPGSDTMEQSYHVLAGSYVKAGETPDLEQLLLDSYKTGETVLIQFEDSNDYQMFLQGLEEQIGELAAAHALNAFCWRTIYQESYKVISVQLEKQ